VAEQAIAAALHEAQEQRVHGAALTPFLLARVAELTGGESVSANQALLLNNASIAAGIARSLVTKSTGTIRV
jgi:pseudouridine-5'-phosphate glycosidase